MEAFPAWAEAIFYEAGLRCARAIVGAAGYRIASERGHVTAIDAADTLTGGSHHPIFVRLHRMRRTRHEFLYETRPAPSRTDLDRRRAGRGSARGRGRERSGADRRAGAARSTSGFSAGGPSTNVVRELGPGRVLS